MMAEGLRKECYELTIDPEFKNLIPPLTEEEHNLLEASLLANGCESPLFTWNGFIVDGHNRYEICRKHGIPFAVEKKDFADRDAALLWNVQTQLGRRNLTNYQKGELALRFEPLIKAQAKERQGQRTDLISDITPMLAGSSSGIGDSRDVLGKAAGISHGTLQKVKKLTTTADDSTKQKLRRGEVSVNKAYTDLLKKADVMKAAKDVDHMLSGASELVVTIAMPEVAEGQKLKRNFSTLGELRDLPEHFPKVAELFRRTLDSCYNGIDINLRQYKPSMVSDENTAALYAMIVSSYEETLEVFRGFMTRTYGKQI